MRSSSVCLLVVIFGEKVLKTTFYLYVLWGGTKSGAFCFFFVGSTANWGR